MSKKKGGCGQAAGGCLIIILLGFMGFAYVASKYQPTQQPETTSDSPTSSPATTASNIIPGLAPVDVYLNLTNKGFTKDGPRPVGDQVYWKISETTADHSFILEIYGPNASTVSTVTASALNFSTADTDTMARDFLGYIATIPYDKSQPGTARDWIKANVSRDASTNFGGVQFEIFAERSPKARMLTIGRK